ncbi:MAG: isoprenylcysteine carboxylmethyltransferase family protein [Prevotellaceae bacterium]|jgi:protein-S-isoprenylcysteine O-methyltransferase Ste14|nr:isoprenylcysteine carboxylmethyltransferase family protein [Prevotellaceae bacterium]
MVNILVITSLAIFYSLFIGRTALLYSDGIKVWVIGTSSQNRFEKILEGILFPFLLLWTISIVCMALNLRINHIVFEILFSVSLLKWIGIVWCYIGLFIFLWALISFGKAWRIGIDKTHSNELVMTGIFSLSRNPIFLFIDIYFMGILLIYPNILFITLTLCTIIGIHFQIIREEKFLLNKFGEKYAEYKRKTRRYL